MVFAGQCAQQAAEGVAAVAEHAGDVFPDERGRWAVGTVADLVDGIGDLHVGQGERAARIGQALAGAGDAEGLAGRAAHQDVRGRDAAVTDALRQPGHVAEVRDVRVAVREHGARERIRLGEPGGLEPERLPGEAHGLDAAAHAAVRDIVARWG